MTRRMRGFSLVDVIVGIALMLILFLSLFGILRASLALSAITKAQAAAVELANAQMEHLHALSYDALGTVGGIPAGTVTEDTTVTQNGISYTTHTFIRYVDDAADGLDASDTNGITTDYKQATVTVSYTVSGQTKSVSLASNFVPSGIESSNGGGTLAINVVDANGAPVSSATVKVVNNLLNPAVNITTVTGSNGQVLLGGAATSSGYQLQVLKTGYSSAQTYAQDATNATPTPGHLTVAKDQTTTQTFAIDRLATLVLSTFSPTTTASFSDTFADATNLAAQAGTQAGGGALTLEESPYPAGYALSGSARSISLAPSYLDGWGMLSATIATTTGTTLVVRVADASGTPLPDATLPGNSVGFSSFPVSLGGVATTTYPELTLEATLTSDATTTTPSLLAWSISHTSGPMPLPNVSFTITGTKTIGSQTDSTPIHKTVITSTTGSTGVKELSLEWDGYALAIPNYDIQDACPLPPYALAPDTTKNASLTLVPRTSNYLDVLVANNAGTPVPGATVKLSRPGYSAAKTTSSCGVAYFENLSSASDYAASATKSGYTTTSVSGVTVSGASTASITFP